MREAYSTAERAKADSGRGTPRLRSRSAEQVRSDLETETTLGWLFWDIHRLVSKDFQSRAKALGLTRVQLRVIGILDRTTGGMSQTELAELTEMEKAPLGKVLDRLEDGGWIIRKNHPADRRARLVYATSKIDKHAERFAEAAKATFAQMLQGVRQSEVKNLIARLQKLKRNLGGADD